MAFSAASDDSMLSSFSSVAGPAEPDPEAALVGSVQLGSEVFSSETPQRGSDPAFVDAVEGTVPKAPLKLLARSEPDPAFSGPNEFLPDETVRGDALRGTLASAAASLPPCWR